MRYLIQINCEKSNKLNVISNYFESKTIREYPKGQILLYQAEQTNSVFFIKKGNVKVYDINSNGDEKLLLILGPGDIYPVIWTFKSSDKLLYFYESMSDIEIAVSDRTDFTREVDKNHEFTIGLLRHFVERIKDLSMRVECLEASNSKYKIAQVLQYLMDRHTLKKSGRFTILCLPTTHQIIASMAGTSRETASTIIKELEDEGVLTQEFDTLGISASKLRKFLSSE